MVAVLTGILLVAAGVAFDWFSSRQHRVASALYGALLFWIAAFFLSSATTGALRILILVLAPVCGGALMCWLLVTGIFLGGVWLCVFLAYAFVFVLPLPIPTVYWGYFALILGICAVWKKQVFAQVLECMTAGVLTVAGVFLVGVHSFERFWAMFAAPSEHLVANAVFLGGTLLVAVGYGAVRIKTRRLEEVR